MAAASMAQRCCGAPSPASTAVHAAAAIRKQARKSKCAPRYQCDKKHTRYSLPLCHWVTGELGRYSQTNISAEIESTGETSDEATSTDTRGVYNL